MGAMDRAEYWETEANVYWNKELENMDASIGMNDLRYLDDTHIYAALFREIEAECPTTEAVAVYCLKAMADHYYNGVVADKYLDEAYQIYDEMYEAGFVDDNAEETDNPTIRESAYRHYYELILTTLGVTIPNWIE